GGDAADPLVARIADVEGPVRAALQAGGLVQLRQARRAAVAGKAGRARSGDRLDPGGGGSGGGAEEEEEKQPGGVAPARADGISSHCWADRGHFSGAERS